MPDESMTSKQTYDIKDIVKILPHRYPFLLVDKIVQIDIDKGIVIGQKNVTINESFFQGHFPEVPLMPGVLILEALAQTGGVLVHLKSNTQKIAVLLSVNHAKFRSPVRPGDVLMLRCEGQLFSNKGGRVQATATVENKIAVQAEIGFALVDKTQI